MKIGSIDFEQSLLRRHLIFKTSRSYQFDLIFQIMINVVLWLFMGMILMNYATYDRNEKSFVYAFIVLILLVNYLLYLKLTEKRLSILQTNNTEAFNRDKILALAKEEHWEIRKNPNGIIITFEDCGDIGLGNSKKHTRIFLLAGNEVLFTIFTEGRRVNASRPFSRSYLKSDLNKALATIKD